MVSVVVTKISKIILYVTVSGGVLYKEVKDSYYQVWCIIYNHNEVALRCIMYQVG